MENTDKNNKDLNNNLKKFLKSQGKDCSNNPDECKIDTRDGLIEVVDKKYVTKDGRQLLF